MPCIEENTTAHRTISEFFEKVGTSLHTKYLHEAIEIADLLSEHGNDQDREQYSRTLNLIIGFGITAAPAADRPKLSEIYNRHPWLSSLIFKNAPEKNTAPVNQPPHLQYDPVPQ